MNQSETDKTFDSFRNKKSEDENKDSMLESSSKCVWNEISKQDTNKNNSDQSILE
jgi:hypothetical protein